MKRYAAEVRMAKPARLKAISTAERKNDALAARTLADLSRCNLFPGCYVPPIEYESLRCYLRERALLVRARDVQEQDRGSVDRAGCIAGVGDVTALTGAVEVGEPSRFPNERHAISDCGGSILRLTSLESAKEKCWVCPIDFSYHE